MTDASRTFSLTIATAAMTLSASGAASAQDRGATDTAPPAATTLPAAEVIGTSPLLGSGIDRDKVPANVRSFSGRELRQEGAPDLAGTLQRRVPGVTINDVQANPFQPD